MFHHNSFSQILKLSIIAGAALVAVSTSAQAGRGGHGGSGPSHFTSMHSNDRGGGHSGGVTVRDHRAAPIVRDHRNPHVIVRDHRRPHVVVRHHRAPLIVRDHCAPGVIVRDHRGYPIVVRDYCRAFSWHVPSSY